MWYVVQVFTGAEEKVLKLCREQIPFSLLEECFVLHYEEMRKQLGEWRIRRRLLFPGYVFVRTEDIEGLHRALGQIRTFTRVLGGQECLLPLTGAEAAFLQSFGGDSRLVKMSRGYLERGRIVVTEGPLAGRESCIRRIDRHRRRAWIQAELLGQRIEAVVGLEIVRKS